MLYVLMIVGCGLFGGDTPDAPAAGAGAEAGTPAAAPVNKEPTSAKPRVPERPAGCHHFFSDQDANHAFGLMSEVQTDCAFEGIRVNGASLIVRHKPTPDSEVTQTLQNAACAGEGDVAGALRIVVPDETRSACPGAVAAVRKLAASGDLPPGTEGSYGE